MIAWIALVVASLLTLALRAGPSLIDRGVVLPETLQRANRFAPPALMGALVSRTVAAQVGNTDGTPVLAAIAVAVLIALRTRSMAFTVAAGAATHLVVAALLN